MGNLLLLKKSLSLLIGTFDQLIAWFFIHNPTLSCNYGYLLRFWGEKIFSFFQISAKIALFLRFNLFPSVHELFEMRYLKPRTNSPLSCPPFCFCADYVSSFMHYENTMFAIFNRASLPTPCLYPRCLYL